MTKRGKVLRDPYAGPGLLMVEGQQYPFALEGVWMSEAPPRPGQVVEVEFDSREVIHAITVVADSQLAKEQADKAIAAARKRGGAVLSSGVAKVGMPTLVAEGLLFIAWFFLTAVSIQLPILGKLDFTFWQTLGFLNSSNSMEAMGNNVHPSPGVYGFLAIVALAGPFIHYVWKDKRALLGGLLPLVFMAIVGIMIRSSMHSALGGGGNDAGALGQQMQDQAMSAISLGLGMYLSVLVSLYFAGVGTKQFLAAKGTESVTYEKPRQSAA
jgi:hypothetical protein